MRYKNNSRQTLKAAVSFSFIALVSGFILNGASITITPNGPQYAKQHLLWNIRTTPYLESANALPFEADLRLTSTTSSVPLPIPYFAYKPSNAPRPIPDHEGQPYAH